MNENMNTETEVVVCAHCGCIIEEGDEVQVGNYVICEDCVGNVEVCEDCGELVDGREVTYVDCGWRGSRTVCEDCLAVGISHGDYFLCDHCGDYYSHRMRWCYDDALSICDNCSSNYRVCTDCSIIVLEEDAYYDAGDYFCESCYNRRGSALVHEYSYKPAPVFGVKDPLPRKQNYFSGSDFTFGVELEIDDGDDRGGCAGAILDCTDMVYLKRDGSLSDSYGLEIVSHPCTLDYHTTVLPWADIMSTAKQYGYRSHEAGCCGLHIHVGLDQVRSDAAGNLLPENTVAKLILLVNRLLPFVNKISRRRGPNTYCEPNPSFLFFDDPNDPPRGEQEYLKNLYRRTRQAGRYVMVNVRNSGTVEFRFFRGTLKHESFMAALQFVHNLCGYAKANNFRAVLNAKPRDVVNFTKFPELTAYVESRCSEDIDSLVLNLVGSGDNRPLRQYDFVKLAAPTADGLLPAGGVGMVALQPDSDSEYEIIDAVWHDFRSGHELGCCLSGRLRHSGWRVHADRMTRIPDREVPAEFIRQLGNDSNFVSQSYADALRQALRIRFPSIID